MKIARTLAAALAVMVLAAIPAIAQTPTNPAVPTRARPVAMPQPAIPAPPACHQVQDSSRGFYPIAMQLGGERLEEDALRVWTKNEIWNPNSPLRTTIWQGVFPVCGGQVIVSQIVNRQCSSGSVCPARVVFRDPAGETVLLDYRQACTIHATFQLRGDLTELRACSETYPLEPRRTN